MTMQDEKETSRTGNLLSTAYTDFYKKLYKNG